jgi:flagellar biogenesis protein FliO
MEPVRALLSILFSLLAIAVWRLRSRGQGMRTLFAPRRARAVEVVESGALAHGQTIHLVRVADRAFVVTAGASGCALLESRPWTELPRGVTGAEVQAS